MLDAAFVRENAAAVKANCVNRQVKNALVDDVVRLDDKRKHVQRQFDELKAEQNGLSDEIKKAGPDKAKREALIVQSKAMKDDLGRFEAELKKNEGELRGALL